MVDEAVFLRIKRLMALANDGRGNEHEMALAASHAQRLMAEHNLTMANIEAAGGVAGEGSTRTKAKAKDRTVYVWRRELMKAVAKLNFCHCSLKWDGKVFDGFELIGREANVASTTVMYEYLVQTIDRLAKGEYDSAEIFTREAFSFRKGVSDRLVERLDGQRQQDLEEAARKADEEAARRQHPAYSGSNAMVVVLGDYVQDEIDLNNDFVMGWEPGRTKRERAESAARSAAYWAEYEAKAAAKQAKIDEYVAAGIPPELAMLMANGYSQATAEKLCREADAAARKAAKPETEAQRRKRLQREESDRRRYWSKQDRDDRKVDLSAYQRGSDAGRDVSLNKQADHQKKGQLS